MEIEYPKKRTTDENDLLLEEEDPTQGHLPDEYLGDIKITLNEEIMENMQEKEILDIRIERVVLEALLNHDENDEVDPDLVDD